MKRFIATSAVSFGLLIGLATAADARYVLHGKASVYANDAKHGWVDHGDNNIPALPGASNENPGIAVMNTSTLGHWWRVCWLSKPKATGCRWVKQTDVGPAGWTGRVVDLNAVSARVLWGIPAWRFPTDQGTWRIALYGKELTKAQLRQARYERCNSAKCKRTWGPKKKKRKTTRRPVAKTR